VRNDTIVEKGETCCICAEELDHDHFTGYRICTVCADILEDVMMEYFVRMIAKQPPHPEKEYVDYIKQNIQHVSDQEKIVKKIGSHVSTMKKRVIGQMTREKEAHRRKFFERSLQVLKFLKDNEPFYHTYFSSYYRCPSCGASLFENYEKEEMDDWWLISCSKCGTVVRRYFIPQLL